MTTKTPQKDIIKENGPYKSTKLYNDPQSPKGSKVGVYVIFTLLFKHEDTQLKLYTNVYTHNNIMLQIGLLDYFRNSVLDYVIKSYKSTVAHLQQFIIVFFLI